MLNRKRIKTEEKERRIKSTIFNTLLKVKNGKQEI
jgi:hypothetical protein